MSNFNDHIKKIFKAKEWFFPSPVKDEVVPKRMQVCPGQEGWTERVSLNYPKQWLCTDLKCVCGVGELYRDRGYCGCYPETDDIRGEALAKPARCRDCSRLLYQDCSRDHCFCVPWGSVCSDDIHIRNIAHSGMSGFEAYTYQDKEIVVLASCPTREAAEAAKRLMDLK